MGTNQLVRFTKVMVTDVLIERFAALVELYDSGVVLADNLFILQEENLYYFYII